MGVWSMIWPGYHWSISVPTWSVDAPGPPEGIPHVVIFLGLRFPLKKKKKKKLTYAGLAQDGEKNRGLRVYSN